MRVRLARTTSATASATTVFAALGETEPHRSIFPAMPTGNIADVFDRPVWALMTADPASVHPSQRLSVVRHAMTASGGHHVPVVEDGRFVGLIAPSDLLRVLPPNAYSSSPEALDRALDRVPLRDAMAEDVVTIGIDASVRDACELLARGGFHCLPVIDQKGELAGLITTSDVIRAVVEAERRR